MTAQLLALAVGPVQEFIVAARRTRDLWFGSYLLSEISKATARAVRSHGGAMIFPAPGKDADFDPGSQLNVANVILAELSDADPATVAAEAKKAARSRWRSFADEVFGKHQSVIRADLWNDQVDDVIEFYSAWHSYSPQTYRKDRAALMRLLAARKRCRDFLPAKGRAGVPKSSLDGLRESVLLPAREWPERSRQRLRLRMGEQLDVVGMVKRVWAPEGGTPRYPSVARVAADPWLRGISGSHLDALRLACQDLGGDAIHEIDISEERGHPHFAAFPFEGTAVFRSRHRDIREEAELSDTDLRPLAKILADVTSDYDEPSPYFAVLVADGDRMGQALSTLESPDDHRRFSRALAGFAGEARRIVNEHNGVLVYAGGDDVLAFTPVDRCLACARSLHDNFGDALKNWATNTGTELTLSVGVAIAHFMEPLEDLLGYGRAAEKHAKGTPTERNGLAVHVVKRGGGALAVRADWSSDPDAHLNRLAKWIETESVSGRTPYDMRKIAEVYDPWPGDIVEDAIQRDVLSMLQGKQPRGASNMPEIANLVRERVRSATSLRGLADEFLVAREIGAASSGSPIGEVSR